MRSIDDPHAEFRWQEERREKQQRAARLMLALLVIGAMLATGAMAWRRISAVLVGDDVPQDGEFYDDPMYEAIRLGGAVDPIDMDELEAQEVTGWEDFIANEGDELESEVDLGLDEVELGLEKLQLELQGIDGP